MNKIKRVYMFVSFAAILGLVGIVPAYADTAAQPNQARIEGGRMMQGEGGFNKGENQARKMNPSVFGKVISINGNIMTISGRSGFGTSTTETLFTIDATNAKIEKNNATSSILSIVVGDTLMVQGSITGTNVVATDIRDGVVAGDRGMMNGKGNLERPATSTINQIQGDGQPVVVGTISAINGTSLTVTNKSNVIYSVDVTNAKIMSGNSTSSISNLSAGNTVVVQGTVNGTSITASSVINQNKNTDQTKPAEKGFFGEIGSFIGHLFGF